MTQEEYSKAAKYWTEKETTSKRMDKDALWKAMEAYIQANNTCALATGSGEFVRCTPIEYAYYDGAFWMFSEGGLKFQALAHNKQVCLAIFDSYQGFGKLNGMQISGIAQLIDSDSEAFRKAARHKNIPDAALEKIAHLLHLIKVTPTRIDFLSSSFQKEGYDSRQFLTFESE